MPDWSEGDHMMAAGEDTVLAKRHAKPYLAIAEEAERELLGPGQQRWLAWLESEQDSLRAAIRSGLSCEGGEDDVLRLVGALILFWRMRGQFTEGRACLDQVLTATGGSTSPARARAIWGRGLMLRMIGEHAAAVADGITSLDAFRKHGDRRGEARSLLLLGSGALATEGAVAGIQHVEAAAALARTENDSWCLAHALAAAGSAFGDLGDWAAARSGFEQCITVALAAGDDHSLAVGLNGLGHVALGQGEYVSAQLHLDVALARARGIGGVPEVTQALTGLALVAIGKGEHERARALLDETMPLADATGSALAMTYATEARAHLARAQGDLDRAGLLYGESLRVAQDATTTSRPALHGLAELALDRNDHVTARRLLSRLHEVAEASGHRNGVADALWGLGQVARLEADETQAGALHCDALALRHEIGDLRGVVDSLEALAASAVKAGRADQATRGLAAAEALRLAKGYVRSPCAEADFQASLAVARQALGDSLHAAAWAEGTSMSPGEAVADLSRGHRPYWDQPVNGSGALTVAEREVATLAAQGMTNAEIGETLFISTNTVKTHLTRVFAKLHLSSRRELTRRLTRDT